MKTKFILTVFSITYFQFLYAQNDNWYEPAPKGMQFVKQGSFDFIGDSANKNISIPPFWMSNEITNKEFREFTDDINKHPNDTLNWIIFESANNSHINKSVAYKQISNDLIDTLALSKEYPINSEKYELYKKYFTDKKYDNYPVVGVSYNSAIYYCIWRTKIEKIQNKNINDFRLPTEEEWFYTAYLTKDDKTNKSKDIQSVTNGKQNSLNLNNIYGNVSEWTSNTAIDKQMKVIKGTSWKNEMNLNERKFINKNTKTGDIGFRIVRSYKGL